MEDTLHSYRGELGHGGGAVPDLRPTQVSRGSEPSTNSLCMSISLGGTRVLELGGRRPCSWRDGRALLCPPLGLAHGPQTTAV